MARARTPSCLFKPVQRLSFQMNGRSAFSMSRVCLANRIGRRTVVLRRDDGTATVVCGKARLRELGTCARIQHRGVCRPPCKRMFRRLKLSDQILYNQIIKLHVPNAEIPDATNQCLCGREGADVEEVF